MPKEFKNQQGNKLVLADQPFATGGEGAIYEVIFPERTDLVAKIYHKTASLEKEQKIRFMHQNNPTISAEKSVQEAIVWIEELLYKEGQFCGFTMPKVSNAISLKRLTLAQNPSQKFGASWKKFDHGIPGSHQKRLVVAYNLAQAINTLHQKGNYVLVDMKPENIFVREDASIAIIDLDSLQINNLEDREVKGFPADVFTEEYVPPEKYLQFIETKNGQIKKEWDYFSLAVIIYELLFGIHPYQASHRSFTTRPELIKEGLFVQGSQKEELHKIPPLHFNFEKLAPELKSQFYQTFEEGHFLPENRTSPARWAEALIGVLNLPAVYETNIHIKPVSKPKSRLKKQKVAKEISVETKRFQLDKGMLAKIVFTLLLLLYFLTKLTTLEKIDERDLIEVPSHPLDIDALEEWELNPHLEVEEVIMERAKLFRTGDTESAVLLIQGEPDRIQDASQIMDTKIFHYGKSAVFFVKGKVVSVQNTGNLKVDEEE